MIPIFDTLSEHLSMQDIRKLVEDNKIITLPLAYMRGITYKNSFVVLDEAQNSTVRQMYLFLTRIGEGTKMVITGDPYQSDIGPLNGFTDALLRLGGATDPIEGLEHVSLDPNEVVRHKIIPSVDRRYHKGVEINVSSITSVKLETTEGMPLTLKEKMPE